MVKLVVVAVIASGVLILSPWSTWFGDDDFEYDLPDVRAAIEGTWRLTASPASGAPATTTFTLTQGRDASQIHASRPLVRPATACSSRSFVKTAGACTDTTFMPLDVRLAGAQKNLVEQGMFIITGTRFIEGELHVSFDGSSVSATTSPVGRVERATLSVQQMSVAPRATLVRVQP